MPLRKVYVVIFVVDFTTSPNHHKSQSPQILVAKLPQVPITTNPVVVFATSICGLSGLRVSVIENHRKLIFNIFGVSRKQYTNLIASIGKQGTLLRM